MDEYMSNAADRPEDVRRRLIGRSTGDEGLRQRLLADPKGTVEDELGASLPEGIEMRVLEESADTIYLVLPPSDGEPSNRSKSRRSRVRRRAAHSSTSEER